MAQEDFVAALLKRHEQFVSTRGNFDTLWQESAERVFWRMADFGTKMAQGQKRDQKSFDSTAARALGRFAAAMEAMLTPRSQRWHALASPDTVINDIPEVRAYFQHVTDILFTHRNHERANFASQNHEAFLSMGAFGNGVMYVIQDPIRRGILYRSCHLADCYFAEDAHGRIDLMHRVIRMTGRAALKEWGNQLPERTRAKAMEKPFEEFEFLHIVEPNEEMDARRADWRGMPYSSIYLSLTDKEIVARGGFRTFPYMVARYVNAPREVYARGPAQLVLSDIKMLDEIWKTMIRAAHKAVDPPLAIFEDGSMTKLSQVPGSLTRGGVDSMGRKLFHSIGGEGRFDVGVELIQERKGAIKDAFLENLWMILVENPRMTATEVLERVREKGELLAPTIGRQQSEYLGPMIERELDLLTRMGYVPPMPAALEDLEGEYKVAYDSPLNRAELAQESLSLARTLEIVGPALQVSENPQREFRRVNMDLAVSGVARNSGMPEGWLRSDEELAAMDQAEQEAERIAAVSQVLPAAAQASKNFAQAEQTRAGG